jgi:hypothetical protein
MGMLFFMIYKTVPYAFLTIYLVECARISVSELSYLSFVCYFRKLKRKGAFCNILMSTRPNSGNKDENYEFKTKIFQSASLNLPLTHILSSFLLTYEV